MTQLYWYKIVNVKCTKWATSYICRSCCTIWSNRKTQLLWYRGHSQRWSQRHMLHVCTPCPTKNTSLNTVQHTSTHYLLHRPVGTEWMLTPKLSIK